MTFIPPDIPQHFKTNPWFDAVWKISWIRLNAMVYSDVVMASTHTRAQLIERSYEELIRDLEATVEVEMENLSDHLYNGLVRQFYLWIPGTDDSSFLRLLTIGVDVARIVYHACYAHTSFDTSNTDG